MGRSYSQEKRAFYRRLGGRLRLMRVARGWDQAELGRRSGLGRVVVMRIEIARQQVYVHQLAALASAFRIKLGSMTAELAA